MSTHIDLIPMSCRIALGRRAHIRRWIGVYTIGVALVAGGYASVAAGEKAKAVERDRLSRQVREKWDRNEEAQRIWKEIQTLEATMSRYERLAWPVRVSDVIAAIGAQLPESLSLTALTLTPRQENIIAPGPRQKAKNRDGRTEPATRTLLAIEIEGLAPTDLALSKFVSGLEVHPLFRNVVLDFARSRTVDGVDARGFRVTCDVDLSVRYTFVDSTPGEVTP